MFRPVMETLLTVFILFQGVLAVGGLFLGAWLLLKVMGWLLFGSE